MGIRNYFLFLQRMFHATARRQLLPHRRFPYRETDRTL
jgi:hypothetical protein